MTNTSDFIIYFLLLPIITSIISAVIFWIVFSVLPERAKKQKIKPILYFEMNRIAQELFGIFETGMRHSEYSPSFFQTEIMCGTLSEHDYKLGLTNKCWNELYRYYPEINGMMDVVGYKFSLQIKKIEKSTNRIFSFNYYLSFDELDILSNIRKLLEEYDIDYFVNRNPVMAFGHPVDPSMTYWAHVLFKLNLEYQKLRTLVKKQANSVENSIHDLFQKKEYAACKNLLEKRLKEKDANHYLWANLFECEYHIGDKKMAIEILTKCFEQFSIPPIYIRDYLFDKLDDTKISELIRLKFGQKAIESIVDAVNNERQQKERFIEQQHKIADFIKKKMSEVHNK